MTDNDYRIEDGSEKGRPNYTLRRVKFAADRERDAHAHLAWRRSDGRACGGGRVSGHGPVADGQVRSAR